MAISEAREGYIEAAAEVGQDALDEQAGEENMTQEEALMFYRMVIANIETRIDAIKQDLGVTDRGGQSLIHLPD